MTGRTCPSGGSCPSQRCPRYMRGGGCTLDIDRVYSQAEVAAEVNASVREVQRIEALVVAWRTLAMCRAIRREIGDLDPGDSRVVTGQSKIVCRVLWNRRED